jgi:AMMECR1 domain-containing protein
MPGFLLCVAIFCGANCYAFSNNPACEKLPAIVRQTLVRHFHPELFAGKKTLDDFAEQYKLTPYYRQRKGVFVTLSKEGKTRACWGSIDPEQKNLVEETVFTTEAALTKDYRHSPIKKSEVNDLKCQVTVVKGVYPISSIRGQNPLVDGLMVRLGGKSGILLPGEAADAHYQLVQCKLKAGIDPHEKCQMYRIKADVFR